LTILDPEERSPQDEVHKWPENWYNPRRLPYQIDRQPKCRMSNFLLNHLSVILCPHGGFVSHIPLSGTAYRVDGQFPMLLGDIYQVSGCPFVGGYNSPCMMVTWVIASNTLIIRSQPALTAASVGLCMSASGIASGPAVIAAVRSTEMEPDELTVITY